LYRPASRCQERKPRPGTGLTVVASKGSVPPNRSRTRRRGPAPGEGEEDARHLQQWTAPKGENGKEKPGELNWLHGVAIDSKGRFYACDIMGKRVQRFLPQD